MSAVILVDWLDNSKLFIKKIRTSDAVIDQPKRDVDGESIPATNNNKPTTLQNIYTGNIHWSFFWKQRFTRTSNKYEYTINNTRLL